MQTGLMCFEVIAKINQTDVDIRKILKEYAVSDNELSKEELIRIIKNSDFKAKIKNILPEDIEAKYPLPAIIIQNDGSYSCLLRINSKDKKVLVFSPVEKQPKEITFEELTQLCNNEFIILSHKMFNSQIKFGFEWFFAEIMTYKQVILEVLLGSFIVQLFGLVTPLFTQVILIMDEATSALDYESETVIMRNMKHITKGRTTFIIAHRLSTVKNCDLIIVMDKGKIIEMGTHSELMQKNGYYKFLNEQQNSNV